MAQRCLFSNQRSIGFITCQGSHGYHANSGRFFSANRQLQHFILYLIVGVVSLEEAADLDVHNAPAFLHLDPTTRVSLQVKINVLKEELILKYFLEEYDLLQYHDRYLMIDFSLDFSIRYSYMFNFFEKLDERNVI